MCLVNARHDCRLHNVQRVAKSVIIVSVTQAVQRYVAYFHANNTILRYTVLIGLVIKNSNKLLPQISQYFVVIFADLYTANSSSKRLVYSCQNTCRMQFTSAFQYTRNRIATTFNIRNIFLHATLHNCPKCFR